MKSNERQPSVKWVIDHWKLDSWKSAMLLNLFVYDYGYLNRSVICACCGYHWILLVSVWNVGKFSYYGSMTIHVCVFFIIWNWSYERETSLEFLDKFNPLWNIQVNFSLYLCLVITGSFNSSHVIKCPRWKHIQKWNKGMLLLKKYELLC